MTSLMFMIKFKADGLSDSMAFPSKIVISSKELAKLDENIYLIGPCGKQWEVKLLKREGHLYLQNGWKEFIQDHYVMEDDRLVFNYCGNSSFTVLIFDKSGCERESSYSVRKGKSTAYDKLLQARQKYISQSSECNECSFAKLGNHDDTQFSLDAASSSGDFYSSDANHYEKFFLPDQKFMSFKNAKDCINFSSSKLRSCMKTKKLLKRTEMKNVSKIEARALHLVKSISKKNPTFLKFLPARSITGKIILVIPRDFVLKCKLFKHQFAKLRVQPQNEWAVEYAFKEGSWVLLWKTFVKDNSLKEGDVCVFELTKYRPQMVMNVHIFKA